MFGNSETPPCHALEMDKRYSQATQIAADQHGAVSTNQLDRIGADRHVRARWVKQGLLEQVGPRSYVVAGSAPTWLRAAWAAAADVEGAGFIAGRTCARFHELDGFCSDEVEVLVRRPQRNRTTAGRVVSTAAPLTIADTVVIDGIRCLTAERLILESPLFGFSREETENAIDSAIRLRRVSEQRLRTKAVGRHHRGINGGAVLLNALVDTGGESRLERWLIALSRKGNLPRPVLQKTFRVGGRVVARVDAFFPGNLVVEVAGHGTHASRRQRQIDEQRRTELTLGGLRVMTFTYDDVRDRPDWVLARLRDALAMAA